MPPSESLAADLALLTGTIDNPEVDLETQLRAVVHAAEFAVASYLGMTVTIVIDGQPVSVTERDDGPTPIGTSLRIPLSPVSSAGPASTLTLYAATAGAFVDLGADLGHALGLPQAALVFDDHLSADGSGVHGHSTQSAINQAIGVLVERGSTPAAASERLGRLADGNSEHLRIVAGQVLRSATRDPGSEPDSS